jgi:DNA-binding NarL/FixJ family response regulator
MMVFNWSAPTLDRWSPQDRLLIAAQASIIGKLLSRSMREFLNDQDLLFPAPVMSLTPRDLELLTLVASGFTSKEIGEMLGRARITVDTHMRTIVSKMGALNRNQAIAKAIAHKLIRVLDGGAAEYKSAKLRAVRGAPRLKSVK